MMKCSTEQRFDENDPRSRIGSRVCYISGVLIGASLGGVEAVVAGLLGYEVFFRGTSAYWHQIAYHSAAWAVLGFLVGRVWDRQLQLQQAFEIIRTQYEDLRTNQQQLIQAEKLAVIGRLAASVAHEIRNPLGIMRSSAGLVAEDLPPDHPGQKPLEFIRDEIDRLSGLIESLLVFAKPKQPLPARTGVTALLDRAMEFMAAEFRKRKIEIRRQYEPSVPEAFVDPDQIYQVFLGLLLNATQAIRQDGAITVRTSLRRDPANGKETLTISVSDTGNGIPAENLERVFEPFFTTREEGTGLGLAVAKQIVTGHGGTIQASGAPERGATFSIDLPVPQAVAA
jgi:signal transduction histidine kinase